MIGSSVIKELKSAFWVNKEKEHFKIKNGNTVLTRSHALYSFSWFIERRESFEWIQ